MSPLRANIRVIGQCSKLAAVQLDVHPQIAVMVWKRIPVRGEVCGFVYTVQLGLQFCDSKGLLRRDGAGQEGSACRAPLWGKSQNPFWEIGVVGCLSEVCVHYLMQHGE